MKEGDEIQVWDYELERQSTGTVTKVTLDELKADTILDIKVHNPFGVDFSFFAVFNAGGQLEPATGDRFRLLNKNEYKFAGELQVIRSTDLRPDDTVVATSGQALSQHKHKKMRDALKKMFPNNQVIILSPGDKLEIVSPKEGD